MNRRRFLRLAGVAGMAAAGVGLVGCSSRTPGTTSPSTTPSPTASPPSTACELLAETSTFTTRRGVAYASDGAAYHVMDVFLPDGAGPFPAVVYIHGGAWMMGSRTSFTEKGRFYAARGIAGFSIDYRLSRPGQPTWPGVLEDVVCAIRHVREHAQQYRVDPQRLAVMGSSAGGHLASMVGTISGSEPFMAGATCPDPATSTRVALVMDYYGPTELGLLGEDETTWGYGVVRQLLGVDYRDDPETWAEASPTTYISADDPVFVIAHGTNDAVVPISQSQSFAARLAASGAEAHLVTVQNGGHGFTSEQDEAVRCVMEPLLGMVFSV